MEAINTKLIDRRYPLASAVDILSQSLDQGDFQGSLANCHTPGMDSLVLKDNRLTNGGMARIFVARKGVHQLGQTLQENGDFVLGVHNHRFPITIVPLLGRFINYEVALNPEGDETLHEYIFSSGITGTIGVDYVKEVRTDPAVFNEQMPGGLVRMQAAEMHTVVIPDQETHDDMTAWLVLEEPEERGSSIYSPTNHLTVSSHNLYQPLSPAVSRDIVQQIISEIR